MRINLPRISTISVIIVVSKNSTIDTTTVPTTLITIERKTTMPEPMDIKQTDSNASTKKKTAHLRSLKDISTILNYLTILDFATLTDTRWTDYAFVALESSYGDLIADKDSPTDEEIRRCLILRSIGYLDDEITAYKGTPRKRS